MYSLIDLERKLIVEKFSAQKQANDCLQRRSL